MLHHHAYHVVFEDHAGRAHATRISIITTLAMAEDFIADQASALIHVHGDAHAAHGIRVLDIQRVGEVGVSMMEGCLEGLALA